MRARFAGSESSIDSTPAKLGEFTGTNLLRGGKHVQEQAFKQVSETDGTPKCIYEAILATHEKRYNAYGDWSGSNLYFI